MVFNVYLVCAQIDGKSLYKIGFTRRSVENRIKEFKTGNASDIHLVNSFQSKWGTKIETILHNRYLSLRVSGEWFDLSDDEVLKFKENCQNIHNNFEMLVNNNTYVLDRIGKNKQNVF